MIFEWQGEVRDYELDLQKILNNSVYMNYMEHARHLALKELGLNFVELHMQGFDLVLAKSEINFKKSLKSQDKFTIFTKFRMEGNFRIICEQEIISWEKALIVKATHIVTSVANSNSQLTPGKIHFPENLKEIF